MHIYGSKAAITIPSVVWRDSAFPYRDKQVVEVEIKGKDLVIRNPDKSKGKQQELLDE